MSEERPKDIKSLVCRLAILPTIVGLRRAEIDTLNVLLIGAWFLWLIFDAVLTASWRHPLMERATKSTKVRFVIVGLVVFVTGWTASSVHRPALTDPEATENKYVRKRWISPSDNKKFARAFLIEFGVSKLNSVGVAVGIQFNGDDFEFWHGEPNSLDRQRQRLPIGWDRSELRPGGIVWLSHPDYQITPQRSLYVCILSYDQDMREPDDVLYFAVQPNEAMGGEAKKQIGHQYRIKQ